MASKNETVAENDEIRFEDETELHPEAKAFCRLSDASLMRLPKREIVSWLRLAIRNWSAELDGRDRQYKTIRGMQEQHGHDKCRDKDGVCPYVKRRRKVLEGAK